MENKISAGIVLFNPNIDRLKENIDAISCQVETVYLQDNGSDNISQVKNLLSAYPNAVLLENNTNNGIAWALNRLCEKCFDNGDRWILTLDQDSVCPINMIQKFETYLLEADMLCPKIVDRNYGIIDGHGNSTEYIDKCITSGSLLSLKAWQMTKGFDEVMFIDGVDFDFCYQMRKKDLKILRINDVILYHEIGNITVRYFLWFKVLVKNHSSFRKYYIARNIIYLAKKRKNIALILKGVLQEIKLIGIAVLYEDDKKNKVKAISKGFIDGLAMRVLK